MNIFEKLNITEKFNLLEKLNLLPMINSNKYFVCYGYSVVSTFFDRDKAIQFTKAKEGDKWCVRDADNKIIYPDVNDFHDLQRILTFDYGYGEDIKTYIDKE